MTLRVEPWDTFVLRLGDQMLLGVASSRSTDKRNWMYLEYITLYIWGFMYTTDIESIAVVGHRLSAKSEVQEAFANLIVSSTMKLMLVSTSAFRILARISSLFWFLFFYCCFHFVSDWYIGEWGPLRDLFLTGVKLLFNHSVIIG